VREAEKGFVSRERTNTKETIVEKNVH
jgi:hypothetical protein